MKRFQRYKLPFAFIVLALSGVLAASKHRTGVRWQLRARATTMNHEDYLKPSALLPGTVLNAQKRITNLFLNFCDIQVLWCFRNLQGPGRQQAAGWQRP
jgi:hypothetical protein